MDYELTDRRYKPYIAKINEATKADTKFYDISEGTGTLKVPLLAPTLPEFIETTPNRFFSQLQGHMPAKTSRIGSSPLDHLFYDFKKGSMVFLGHAGSGKTSLLKHIAHTVLEDELLSLNGVELVLYIKCQDISPNTPIKDEDLFLRGLHDDDDVRKALMFIESNQSKCLFLVDSVETCLNSEDLHRESNEQRQTTNGGKRQPGIILRSLLSGRRFPNARVIATSRESLLFIYPNLHEARTVVLSGLSTDSICNIMKTYLGIRKATKEWENLNVKSPHLAPLCRTPVFLVFVLMAEMSGKKSFTATTVSEVMIRLLECFLHSEQARQENIEPVIQGLKSISYEGMNTRKFSFSKPDFQEHNLAQKEIGDFVTQHWLLKMLFRGKTTFHFNHVSLQEAFAALFIAEMGATKFKECAMQRLFAANPMLRSDLTWKLVFGFLLDSQITKDDSNLLINHPNLERNKEILLEILRRLLSTRPHLDDIEIISALHEAQDGVSGLIRSNVNSIKIEKLPLIPNVLYVIGSVVGRCQHLNELSICEANLTAYSVEILYNGIKGTGVKISKLALSNNPNLGPEGLNYAGKLASECKSNCVKLNGCIWIPNDILNFQKAMGGHKVESLDLSWNTKVSTADMMTPETEDCRGLYYFKAATDSFHSPNFSKEHLMTIKKQLKHQEFEHFIQISGGWKIGTRELCLAVMNIFPCVAQKIKLYGWKFSEDDIDAMAKHLTGVNRKGLRVLLAKDRVIPAPKTLTQKRPEVADPKFKDKIMCKTQGESIKVCWDSVDGAEQYCLEVLRGGTKVEKHEVNSTTFVVESIEPSTTYEFHVTPRCRDGKMASKFVSRLMMTKPKPPVDVEATETKEGIRVTFKPSEGDNVEKYAVKTFHDKQMLKNEEVFGESPYLLRDTDPGHNYQFGICVYNVFGRRGEMTMSNVVTTSDEGDEKCFGEIRTADELHSWCRKRHDSNNGVHFQEIQIAHHPLDEDTIRFLASVLRLSSTVGELEMRDCEISAELLHHLHDGLEDPGCKVEELTIGAQKNLNDMISVLCNIVRSLGAGILNLAENEVQPETIRSLLLDLTSNQAKCLKGLDISFNKNIQNWEDVGNLMIENSLTILKAMNCDLTLQNVQNLKKGCPESKVQYLDLSYNSELSVECFEILPTLLSNDAKSLVLSECGLTKYEIKAFDKSAPPGMKVETIDVSYNEDLEAGGMSSLGQLAVNRKSKNLSIAGCYVDGELLEALSDSLGTHKLSKVDMSDNPSIGDEVRSVGKFAKKQKIENLDISECGLSAAQITSFQNGLGGAKVSVLNLSDSSRSVDSVYINSICSLLPLIEEELLIIFPHMEVRYLEILQQSLNKVNGDGPKITYATTTECTNVLNGIKFTVGTEKKSLQKN